MRIGTILGTALILLGAFIGLRGLNYRTQRNVVQVGDFKATMEEQRPIPPWVGGLVFVAGLGLVAFSLRGKRES